MCMGGGYIYLQKCLVSPSLRTRGLSFRLEPPHERGRLPQRRRQDPRVVLHAPGPVGGETVQRATHGLPRVAPVRHAADDPLLPAVPPPPPLLLLFVETVVSFVVVLIRALRDEKMKRAIQAGG